MALLKDSMFTGITADDEFTVKDNYLYRNGKSVPFIGHDKRDGRTTFTPKFFVYHFSSGRDSLEGLVSYMKAKGTEADVQLCMDRDGRLVQMAPLNEKCWHAGKSSYKGLSGLNSYSFGIEVINPGPLDILGKGLHKSWFGEVYKNDPAKGIVITEAVHALRGGPKKGWMNYTPAQIKIMTNLAILFKDVYGTELVGHDEITTRKSDPGPVSQIDKMRAMIASRASEDGDGEDEKTGMLK